MYKETLLLDQQGFLQSGAHWRHKNFTTHHTSRTASAWKRLSGLQLFLPESWHVRHRMCQGISIMSCRKANLCQVRCKSCNKNLFHIWQNLYLARYHWRQCDHSLAFFTRSWLFVVHLGVLVFYRFSWRIGFLLSWLFRNLVNSWLFSLDHLGIYEN